MRSGRTSRRSAKRETRYVWEFAVLVSSGGHILNAMRYDSCFPNTEEDAFKIERLMDCSDRGAVDAIVRLTRVGRNEAPPNEEQWRSHGCRVIAYWHPEETPPTDAELQAVIDMNLRHAAHHGD